MIRGKTSFYVIRIYACNYCTSQRIALKSKIDLSHFELYKIFNFDTHI